MSSVHDLAREHALGFPSAERSYPFGPQTEVFKVQGKVFLLLGSFQGSPIVTAKARPADARILSAAYAEVRPGYHMNKKHWISVQQGNMPTQILSDIVTESYLLVVESLPQRLQPVNPKTYGTDVQA